MHADSRAGQILEDAIRYRWKILPNDQREGIKSYIVGKLLSVRRYTHALRVALMTDCDTCGYRCHRMSRRCIASGCL